MACCQITFKPFWGLSVKVLNYYMLYPHHVGNIVPSFFPRFTWQKDTAAKEVYLTFDDGPIPEVTDFVLNQLAVYEAKATFFCVGDNMSKYPHIVESILAQGHGIANHTHNHLNGWQTANPTYFDNIAKCQTEIDKWVAVNTKKLFRPPYGRITSKQTDFLLPMYEIVMWTVLSGDFDQSLSPQKCLEKTTTYTDNGAIVVFHDSLKAAKILYEVLPKYLDYLYKAGYQCKKL
jgi:peptidoglycan-N-acetylglucosamine deacetylase